MDDSGKPVSIIRRIMPFMIIAIVIAGLYDGWIFYSRWSGNRDAENARRANEAAQARHTLELLGGDELKILSFNAARASVAPGGTTTLCYGVENAKAVRIDPPVGDVYPALSHCVEIAPRKRTTYTLTAEDAAGHSTSAALTVGVR